MIRKTLKNSSYLLALSKIFSQRKFHKSYWIIAFLVLHGFLAIFLGRLFAFAPDERDYLFTFNNVYTVPMTTTAQSGSGWVAAPTIFLWVAYLPAKIMNILGAPDYLAIRIESIFLITVSLYIHIKMLRENNIELRIPEKFIFLPYLFPSIFLWTTLGLKESFILLEITIFLAGINYLFQSQTKKGVTLIFLGSYSLVSTKNYLWACLMVSVLLSALIFLVLNLKKKKVLTLVFSALFAPFFLFSVTASEYALNFIVNSSVGQTGSRSGDSISKISLDSNNIDFGVKNQVIFHGDFTVLSLNTYLKENPNSLVSEFFKLTKLDQKVNLVLNDKIQAGLESKGKEVGTQISTLNSHILSPGKFGDPLSIIRATSVFLFGPIPFVESPGIITSWAALESPLWWAFYTLLVIQFFKHRKSRPLLDPQIIFTLIFLIGEILFSGLVEVNLGTSFRHRSIILVPLIFMFIRLQQVNVKPKDLK